MAQFDVYRNRDPGSRRQIPYLLDIQSNLLSQLATRVVVPLVREDRFGLPARRLNPIFEVAVVRVVMSTQELAGIHISELGDGVGTLAMHRDDIVAALDFIIQGF